MGWTNQVVQASEVIIGGAPDALLVYAGTPGAGKLIASITSGSLVDPFGNTTEPTISAYGQGPFAGDTVSLQGNALVLSSAPFSSVVSIANVGGQAQVNSTGLVPATWAFNVPVTATAGSAFNPTLITTDAPNSVTPPANTSGSIVYQLLPTGQVSVDVRLTVAAAAAAGTLALASLLGPYLPARDQRGPVGFFPNGAPTVAQLTAMAQMRWEVTTGGAINVLAFVGGAAGGAGVTELDFTIVYPLT